MQHHTELWAICGDINCDIGRLAALREPLVTSCVHDLAMYPHLTGRTDVEPTCLARNAQRATRRDYFLASRALFPRVRRFAVCPGEGLDVRKPID
eukprot:10135911-Alexandrium_andersonii.AAC.1